MLPILLAQNDYSTLDPAAADAAGAAVAGFVGIWIFIWIVIVIAALIGLILWIWAIIDVSKRQFENPSNKTTWLIVLIVGFVVGLSLIAAIIYLIAGRKQGTMPGQAAPQAPSGQGQA
jgi:uncharacterized integral membrane protein